MKLLATFILTLFVFALQAQNQEQIIQSFLNKNYSKAGLTKSDIQQWVISSHSYSKQSGGQHVYIQQTYQDIKISNAVANFAIKDGKVISMGNRFVAQLAQKIKYDSPALSPQDAVVAAAAALKLEAPNDLKVVDVISNKHYIFNKAALSRENIPVELVYFAKDKESLELCWKVGIYQIDGQHWWKAKIDAQKGVLLDQQDQIIQCNFDHSPFERCDKQHRLSQQLFEYHPQSMQQPDQYTVFAIPAESPSHGNRTMVVNPADTAASPYGWHDTNGSNGAEYTITRGNNVYAYEDAADNNTPGFSPDGTASLDFNFSYGATAGAAANQSSAITNLFYMNNIMHDVWYQYGFDEISGNFQFNNYGNGGVDDDYVLAEAQDGGGTNNANFATPEDGFNPRMQMYLWTGGGSTQGSYLDVNSPTVIAGPYNATEATFGPGLPASPITADIAQVIDNTAPVNDGCETLTNAAALAGKIALIDRGNCSFTIKVESAQNAGALAVIIVNNVGTAPIQMGGTNNNINIPSIMISQADGNNIKAQLSSGTVNATISDGGVVSNDKDGDFDNGIIAHEYGHGISTRLCGGANNSSCLQNAEQMGEGWSDWFGLMLTMEPGDLGSDVRGIGTYASGQPTTGTGIRPAPYCTDFAVNNYTYGASNNTGQISEPHGVGFIFATALWDLNWALINQYGGTPNPDVYRGNGGNNIAMQLVIEALKLQPCSPGMVDGRDAILQADQLLYNGIHECLIWDAFANRGFGFSATQGSSSSRTDQTEAFDLPPSCLTATTVPVANFNISSLSNCNGVVLFQDSSSSVPQNWSWDFGDGSSDTLQNPSHTYNSSGSFVVRLVVGNNIGYDTTYQSVTIQLPPNPTSFSDVFICIGDSATFSATGVNTLRWLDSNGNLIDTGTTFTTPILNSNTTYQVENAVIFPKQQVGPVNNNFGGGGYHGTGFTGTVNFTASKELDILSAWVDAENAGNRTFYLWDDIDGTGSPIQQVTVNIPNGQSRINLDFNIPSAGDYSIGASLTTTTRLYRNNAGANYPYDINGLISLTGSPAGTDFYYYLYDLEVMETACISPAETVTAFVNEADFTYTDNNGLYSFTDASTGASSWLWDFGDGNNSSIQNPSYSYTIPGSYTVTLSINNGLCTSTQTINVVVVATRQIEEQAASLKLYPNPADESTLLSMNQVAKEDLYITVKAVDGKVIEQLMLPKGDNSVSINTSRFPSAIYLINCQGKMTNQTIKLVVD
jgi:PKD repeat protein